MARGKGEGSVYKTKRNGRGYWCAQIEAGMCGGDHLITRGKNKGETCPGHRLYQRAVRRYRADAVKALHAMQGLAELGVKPSPAMDIPAYLDFWHEMVVPTLGIEPQTAAVYKRHAERLRPHVRGIRLRDLTGTHVAVVARHLTESHAPSTAGATVKHLRRTLDWAVTVERWLPHNPATGVSVADQAAQTDDTLTLVEVEKILASEAASEHHALLYFALTYGLRVGEMVNLRWQDVSDDEMTVVRSKTRAGERTIPLTDEAADVLRAHRERSTGDGFVFVRDDGRPMTDEYVRRMVWNPVLRVVGIAHKCRDCGDDEATCSTAVRRFHAARHSAATILLNRDVELEVVSKILGHSSIKVTSDIYAKPLADQIRRRLTGAKRKAA